MNWNLTPATLAMLQSYVNDAKDPLTIFAADGLDSVLTAMKRSIPAAGAILPTLEEIAPLITRYSTDALMLKGTSDIVATAISADPFANTRYQQAQFIDPTVARAQLVNKGGFLTEIAVDSEGKRYEFEKTDQQIQAELVEYDKERQELFDETLELQNEHLEVGDTQYQDTRVDSSWISSIQAGNGVFIISTLSGRLYSYPDVTTDIAQDMLETAERGGSVGEKYHELITEAGLRDVFGFG